MFVTQRLYEASEARYARLEARYDALLERYHALRLLNHVATPIASEREAVAPPQNDVDLVYHTQRAMALDAAYQDFKARGLTDQDAHDEAQRAIDSLFAPVAGEFQ